METSTNNIKIDYIFPYVNSNDIEWKNDYVKYKKTAHNTDDMLNGIVRYKDYGILDIKMESIYKNIPWINNIFIIVCNESQLSDSFREKYPNVKIIYHKDFIPEEFLPTFNSNTIEMFLGNIEELSEYFIYSNDDILVTSKIEVSDFFENGLPVIQLCKRKKKEKTAEISKAADYFIHRGLDLVRNENYSGFVEDDDFFLTFNHADKAMLKQTCKKVLEQYKDKIYESITRFRDYKNMNVYLFLFYQVFNEDFINKDFPYINFDKNHFVNIYLLYDSDYKNVSIDFCEDIDDYKLSLFKQRLRDWADCLE